MMWWGRYTNENGRGRWRSGFGWRENNSQPIDERDDTRIDPDMTDDEIDARLRRRIALRRQMYREFFGHLVSYLGVNAILWAFWGVNWIGNDNSDFVFPWPIFVTLFWGLGLVSHAVQVYQSSGSSAARREQQMQREVEQERARLGLERAAYEKPKRTLVEQNAALSNWVKLSDDGELIPAEEEQDSDRRTANQQSQKN